MFVSKQFVSLYPNINSIKVRGSQPFGSKSPTKNLKILPNFKIILNFTENMFLSLIISGCTRWKVMDHFFILPSSLYILWVSSPFNPGGSYLGRATASYSCEGLVDMACHETLEMPGVLVGNPWSILCRKSYLKKYVSVSVSMAGIKHWRANYLIGLILIGKNLGYFGGKKIDRP